MPDTKLPALPAVTSAADDDLIYMVDVSDTTDDPTGTSVGIEKSDLFAGITGGSGGNIGNASRVLIQEIELTSAGEFDFDNIPDGYDRLILSGSVRSDKTGTTVEALEVFFNTDLTKTNYHRQNNYGENGTANVAESASPQIGLCPTADSVAGSFADISIIIEDYTGINLKNARSSGVTYREADWIYAGGVGMVSAVTAALTRLRVRGSTHPTDGLLGKLQLIGEKVSVSETGTLTDVEVKIPIETITDPASGEFDFTVPAGYDRIIIEGNIKSTEVTNNDGVRAYLNADLTDANYHSQILRVINANINTAESNNPFVANVVGTTAPANTSTTFRLVLTNYESGDLKQYVTDSQTYDVTDGQVLGTWGVVSSITASVTRIRIRTDNFGTDDLTGTLRIYGEKTTSITALNSTETNTQTMTVKKRLETITLTTAGEFDFDNIPAGYDRLIIQGAVRSDVSNVADGARVFFNADSTDANYFYSRIANIEGAVSAVQGAVADIASVPAGTAPTDSMGFIELVIENYDGSNLKQAINKWGYYRNTTDAATGQNVVTHKTMTVALTRIRIRTDNHATDQLLGELTLYAEKEVVVASYGADAAGTTVQAKIPIAEIDNTAAAGEFDFDNIPAGYDRLIIEGDLRGDVANPEEHCSVFLNNDTTPTNYHRQTNAGDDGVAVVGEAADALGPSVPAANAPANSYGSVRIELNNYTGTNNLKLTTSHFNSHVATDRTYVGERSVVSAITAAITRLRIRSDNHATNQLFGTLTLYGEKQIIIAPGKHELETITNTSGGLFDFTNIPSGYKRLIIEGYYRSSSGSQNVGVSAYINGDFTAANYLSQLNIAWNNGALNTETDTASIFEVPGSGALANANTTLSLIAEGYDQPILQQLVAQSIGYRKLTTGASIGSAIVVHDSETVAINRITIQTVAATDLVGRLTLYGEH